MGRGSGIRVKWCELNRIPIDLANVEIFAHRGDVRGGDVICGAPDAVGGCVLCYISVTPNINRKGVEVGQGVAHAVSQSLPVRFIDEGYDAAWCGGGAAVVFTSTNSQSSRPDSGNFWDMYLACSKLSCHISIIMGRICKYLPKPSYIALNVPGYSLIYNLKLINIL